MESASSLPVKVAVTMNATAMVPLSGNDEADPVSDGARRLEMREGRPLTLLAGKTVRIH